MQKEIENEARFKKDVYDTGFGHTLNSQYDAGKAAGKKEMILNHERTMEAGEMKFEVDVKIGQSRVFNNGYKAMLYAGLYIDRTVDGVKAGLYPDTTVNGVDLRNLVGRIQSPPDESMVNVANQQAFDKLFNEHMEDVSIDMEKIRQREPETFLGMMARYQPMQADGATLDAVTTYTLNNVRSRWFNADEKITIEEAGRMLMDSESPRAVRKPLQVGKSVEELLTEWEQGNPKVPRTEILKDWTASERNTLKDLIAITKLPEDEAKKELQRNVFKRFKTFMVEKSEKGQGPNLDFYKIVPTWMVIDFSGQRTASGNLPLIRIPDPDNYLFQRLTDYLLPELQKEGKLREVVKSLSQGKAVTITTGSTKHPEVIVTANPIRETITIRDAVYKGFLAHDQFRTPEARERIAMEQQQKSENRRDDNNRQNTSAKNQDGEQKKNKPGDVVGKAPKQQPASAPAKLKPKNTTRKFASPAKSQKGRRPG